MIKGIIFVILVILTSCINANNKFEVCNGIPYNPVYYRCCFNTIVINSGISDDCCGQRINPAFKMCCNGNILSISATKTKCCGGENYDPNFDLIF